MVEFVRSNEKPKAFDKWFAQITKEYPMYQDGEGYNIGNTRALMVGWRAALRMVSKKCDELDDICCLDCGCFGMVVNKIDEELG